MPQIRFNLDRVKAQRLGVAVSDVFTVLQTNLGGYYVNDFNLYGKVWKVMVQAEGSRRVTKDDIERLYVLNQQGQRVRLDALGDAVYALGPIDVPHYNMYNAAKITGQPAAGYSSGQAIAAMERVADKVLPEGFSYEWTGTTFQEQKTGNLAMYIFALSIVCVFLFMAALYESWIRPLVIILTVPLAMFGAMIGLWLYDMPLDVFGQIGLVMLIGLETKNAILVVEFGVELQAEARHEHHRLGQGSVAPAVAADPDDIVRVHHGRLAHGQRHRRRRLQPELTRRRDRLGHAGEHGAGPIRHPDLLRAGRAHQPVVPRLRRRRARGE